MKIVSVIGTRPQFIKVYPVAKECQRRRIPHVIVNTGQHYSYELDQIFVEEFRLPKPKYNLRVKSGTHSQQIARILLRLEPILQTEKPDVVLVYGDTNSTLGAALCAAKLEIPVGHVEAGPRSYDRTITEEINRVTVDHLSTFHFCPVPSAVRNLRKEGIHGSLVGNIAVETLVKNWRRLDASACHRFGLEPGRYVLATIHHSFSTDRREVLREILQGLIDSGERILLPLHPRLKKNLRKFGLLSLLRRYSRITICPPLDYQTLMSLLKYSKKLITDSGGNQYEGYVLGVPTLVLRSTTEWPETLNRGCRLIPNDRKKIARALLQKISHQAHRIRKEDRNVSKRIIQILKKRL